ncbi:MAG: lysine--tRNA ligase [Alphaproteobacteria bacterium]|nr:lysine--tRNA ligase [Alphaproteobacteria bacterium]
MYEFDPKRLEKLAALRDSGIAPYPNGLPVTHALSDVIEAAGDRPDEVLAEDTRVFTVAGRLRFKNEMGRAGFARIQDQSGRLQIYVRKNLVGPERFADVWKKLDLGDQVWVAGTLMRTRTGELTLKATDIALYAKCLESLPDKHNGFLDPELRRRMRYVDLFMNDDSRETFRLRSAMVRYIRDWFHTHGFMEVETPMMQVIPGGANARPFVTHHNALGMDLYLRIAPELYLKRLVVGGFERVFELNRNFRNEGVSQKHNPEFTMLEFYQAHATFHDLMDETEDLVSGMAQALLDTTEVTFGDHTISLERPWRRASMAELISEATGVEDVWDVEALRARWLTDHPDTDDLPTTVGKWFELFFDAFVEPGLIQPTFVTGFPTEISPLSRRSDADPRVAERFELFIGGSEYANGFSELNDPVDQAQRFAAQAEAKAGGDEEAMFFDHDYVRALSYGMPPAAGEGIGIDRLVMLFANRASIRDVILFPTLRPESGRAESDRPSDPAEG